MMMEPAPAFPLLPTATQSSSVEHEMAVRLIALEGGDCADQVAPLLDVPSANGVELRFVPTAMHCVPFGQLTAAKVAPIGMELVETQVVKLVVLSVVAFPADLMPVATHVVPIEHDSDVRALRPGEVRAVHG
jgi:hypothetical protein